MLSVSEVCLTTSEGGNSFSIVSTLAITPYYCSISHVGRSNYTNFTDYISSYRSSLYSLDKLLVGLQPLQQAYVRLSFLHCSFEFWY